MTIAFSLVSAASNMSIALNATSTSSGSNNLNNLNGDPTPQSHKPCSNGSAPDINGNCTSSIPHRQSSSLENNTSIPAQPSQLLPSPTTTTCPDGSAPDANGYCTPYPLPPAP